MYSHGHKSHQVQVKAFANRAVQIAHVKINNNFRAVTHYIYAEHIPHIYVMIYLFCFSFAIVQYADRRISISIILLVNNLLNLLLSMALSTLNNTVCSNDISHSLYHSGAVIYLNEMILNPNSNQYVNIRKYMF